MTFGIEAVIGSGLPICPSIRLICRRDISIGSLSTLQDVKM